MNKTTSPTGEVGIGRELEERDTEEKQFSPGFGVIPACAAQTCRQIDVFRMFLAVGRALKGVLTVCLRLYVENYIGNRNEQNSHSTVI